MLHHTQPRNVKIAVRAYLARRCCRRAAQPSRAQATEASSGMLSTTTLGGRDPAVALGGRKRGGYTRDDHATAPGDQPGATRCGGAGRRTDRVSRAGRAPVRPRGAAAGALRDLQGQLRDLERKPIEPLALALPGGDVQALQHHRPESLGRRGRAGAPPGHRGPDAMPPTSPTARARCIATIRPNHLTL